MNREAAARWLSLVAADEQLSAYLIGVDWERLKAQVARTGEVPCLGWSEAEQRRAESYLRRGGFWAELEERCPGLLPERDAPLVEAALRRLAVTDDRPERLALLTVLGRAYRRFGLRPDHQAVLDTVLGCAVPWRKVEWAAARVGDGPAWWPAEVLDRDLACAGVAVLTVRPWRRLPFRAGQAVPVGTPRRPGRWRWLCPANAPRPDGTVELHVRAVRGGAVSPTLAHEVRVGELLHLGPPIDTGLSLHDGDLLLIAGGTGLAPLRAIVEQVAAAPDGRRVTLVVGARSVESLYDAVSLDKLRHDWLSIVPAFSHDRLAEPAEQGDALSVGLFHHRPGQRVYVCGPPAMLAGSRLRLLAAGVPADRIHLPDRIPWR
ncbi:FAD-binding oxidoreductase [Micromonospora auratinigra]|uniref:NAD(P)H-flavin reductase n=1 Tax=Micromonospora auratinigra TaxID=261654 RepID=A0A1A9A8F2_9ACTN|nr:FAD-binding oxidoreductase [Micromonospora auratinigra]SBT52493.1 NAD(P)H-flavin reductase [Micromonospora auratinigra]